MPPRRSLAAALLPGPALAAEGPAEAARALVARFVAALLTTDANPETWPG